MTVYSRDYWWSDKWDQLASGRDYDFSKPFFTQFAELMKHAPLPNLAITNCVNSEYGNHSMDCKNCYLFHASVGCENVAYATGAVHAKDSFDVYKVLQATQCYEVILSGSINKVFFSFNSDENLSSAFLFGCRNMQESLACVNMRNRSHCIFNQPYTKEEYVAERAKYDLGSYRQLEELKGKFAKFVAAYPRRYATVLKSVNVVGDHVINAKNCTNVFDVFGGLENCKYICHASGFKDSYDGYGMGYASELLYEGVDVGAQATRCMFNVFTHGCQEARYTYACHGSSNLFGCVGLRSKQYCILNKQYAKEEYEKLVPKIVEHMKVMPYIDAMGRSYAFGEFFPIELSPFAYNETIAQEYAPLTRERAVAQSYRWKEPEVKHYVITMPAEKLPDHIKDASDSILNEIIGCAHAGSCNQQCATAFKVIPSELQFCRHFNIALPRLCPNCRHYERLAKRNPFKLWKRTCQCVGATSANGVYKNLTAHSHGSKSCSVEFQTPHAPNRPEIVYCESCYNSEVV